MGTVSASEAQVCKTASVSRHCVPHHVLVCHCCQHLLQCRHLNRLVADGCKGLLVIKHLRQGPTQELRGRPVGGTDCAAVL